MTDQERFWTNKLKAVIYVRVSSEGQVSQWHGLDSQESACRDWCQRQSWMDIEVVKVFREEGVSWKFIDRKAINESIKFLEKENRKFTQIHYFVVTDADRIVRPDDIAEAFTLEQSIEGLGAKIVTVNNKRDMETDEGKFLHTIQYAIAGLERRKILRRTMNWRLSSLKKGGRPFTYPPLWYTRERFSDKWYVDNIDEIKWSIIKAGLELYAYNPLFTKSQLHQYWVDKGLQTSQWKGRLYLSFIDKIIQDYKLYFYAWYIYYPERGVDTPVKWKQDALVSLEVVEKILEKETRKEIKMVSPNIDENLKLHPLKGLVTCYSCWRKLGCYKTTKKKSNTEYFYYDCGNKYCEKRQYIPKETMESIFEEFIGSMEIPKQVFDTFKNYILEEWESEKHMEVKSIAQIQWQLLSIRSKMEKIEERLLTISNDWQVKKLEEEWATLETLKEDLTSKLNNQKSDANNLKKTLSQAECLFTKPVQMRKKSSYELRQLLFRVRFSWILYYEKNLWYRTNDTTGLHYLFSPKWDTDYRVMAQGGTDTNQISLTNIEYETICTILIAQSQYINAIWKVSEIHGLNLEK